MKLRLLILLWLDIADFSIASPGSMMVRTLNGIVRGKRVEKDGKITDAYMGIPYAKPPLGKLRYKHPVPADPWGNVLEADRFPPSCHQRILEIPGLTPTTEVSEDCLYLNVFVPRHLRKGSAVLVFVHGGGFSTGSTSAPAYNVSTFAIQENIITVSMNYRLASFGFLHLEHPDFEPNRGLMDQMMALKWVRDNVVFFGGDPNKVTLMGVDAGGFSVTLHLLSHRAGGLFKRVIMDSGVGLTDWATLSRHRASKLTYQLAKNLNCSNPKNVNSVAECLQGADAREIMKRETHRPYFFFVFRPVVDGVVIPEAPIRAYRKKPSLFDRVDSVLLGFARNEGTIFMAGLIPRVFVPSYPTNEDVGNQENNATAVLPSTNSEVIRAKHKHLVQMIDLLFEFEPQMVRSVMVKHYTDLEHMETSQEIMHSCERLLSEYLVECATSHMANLYTQLGAKVFSYYFDHRSSAAKYAKWLGVVHGEQCNYVLGLHQSDPDQPRDDALLSERLMRLWGNFIRTGDPNIGVNGIEPINWPRMTEDNSNSLILSSNETRELRDIAQDDKKCYFWDETFYELREAASNVNN